ncbi:general odorant-binding protein 70 isoform X2 [Zootermopsis nevadensis]|uniref:general odorant-binding protein 70 isoform X2 n=1 Tax=Zootermopsis nevadensis TaxID=136037 RepID=UPI000B8E938B|nr:general odorant-binding protein 70 isoform X2 [Zootermopsis nevadensis]
MFRFISIRVALILTVSISSSLGAVTPQGRCQSPAIAPQRIEKVIADCQDEIKLAILQEALVDLEASTAVLTSRTKRQTFSEDERRIAGCLLQCVYKKVRAVDASGFPTREGLVRLYAEGVQERGYYLATAEASEQCLHKALQSRLRLQPSGKQSCDLAYDLFECISNKLSEYCSGFD